MKRDVELIRQILIEVEDRPPESAPMPVSGPDGADAAAVREHVRMLIDADLLKGRILPGAPDTPPIVFGLSWAGHEFLAVARNDTLWRKALEFVAEKGSAVTLPVLSEVLKTLARGALGLP
jgi:hypothetical protein